MTQGSLDDLRAFRAVAHERSFARAAAPARRVAVRVEPDRPRPGSAARAAGERGLQFRRKAAGGDAALVPRPLPGGVLHEVEVVPGTVIPEPAVLWTVLPGGAGIGRLPDYRDDTSDVHALYPGHRSLSAEVRGFIHALAEHLSRTA